MPTPAEVLSLADLQNFDLHPTRHGANTRFCCPLPDCQGKPINRAHQSLAVQRATGQWCCHRCKASGLLREFWTPDARPVNRYETARRNLRRQCALPPLTPPVPPASETPWRSRIAGAGRVADTPGAVYLAERGIPVALATAARVRYCAAFDGRPAALFPVYDADLRLVAAQGRYVDGRDPKTHSAGSVKSGVFATPGAWDAPTIVITEAPIDALSLHRAGVPAFALCGTALRVWLPLHCAWKRVALAFDADDAGERAAQEWRAALLPVGARPVRLRPEGAKDWNELLRNVGEEGLRRWLTTALPAEADLPPLEAFAPSPDPIAVYVPLLNKAKQQQLPEGLARRVVDSAHNLRHFERMGNADMVAYELQRLAHWQRESESVQTYTTP